ncbi:MAG: substrate-binding domain-containing protein [Anaerolineae bacterium]|nr:substrate-binding domain-containing protein [Anaerolineae bacterium]
MATIRDVAKHARVSVATVSHVINDTRYVSPELRQRVLDAIEALDYRPNRLAQALSKRTMPLLALIVPDISNPYWSHVARAVQDLTDEHDYSVIVCSTDGLLKREVRFLRSLSGWISGLIVHPYHVTPRHVNRYMGATVPVVILGDFLTAEKHPSNWDCVCGDNQGAAQTAVEHLLDLGHRCIAFIQGPSGTPTGTRRLAGFRRAFELAGYAVDEGLVVPGDYTRDAGRKGIARLLDMEHPPTAVFCANDLIALGALETARLRGYRVPQDISVVGFDDIDEAERTSPPLTTIRQPPRRLGVVAAETLIERLTGRTEPRRISIDFSLMVRESTASPRKIQAVPA